MNRPPASAAADTRLAVRVTPRASRNEIRAEPDGTIRVRLQAPPVDNKANAALVELLAEALGVPRRDVSLLAGGAARTKHLLIRGLAPDAVRQRLASPTQ